MSAAEVEELEVRLLLDGIHARYGYDLRDYDASSMRRRVRLALAKSGLDSLGALQHEVLADPLCFGRVLEALTVKVSEMFRDPAFFHAFRTGVVPTLRTYPLIRIWHAGCASGEEVYATAIVLREAGLHERVQLYGTDISASVLDQARDGLYGADRVTTFTDNYQRAGGTTSFSDYYTAAYGGIAMSESLRRQVVFFQHDLVSQPAFGEMHVVFCRNVLIYFGKDSRRDVLQKLTACLCPGGFLCLGPTESLSKQDVADEFVAVDERHRLYRRAG